MQPIQPKISYMAEVPHLHKNNGLEEIVHSHIKPSELIEKIESMNLYQVISNIAQLKMDVQSFNKSVYYLDGVITREIEIDKQLIKLLKHRRDFLAGMSEKEPKLTLP